MSPYAFLTSLQAITSFFTTVHVEFVSQVGTLIDIMI
jgi:hypothetical protein